MPDPTRLTLILTGGPQDGTALSWGKATERTLGSGNDCDLRIPRGNVAVLHARIARRDAKIVLIDAGSSMGTFVNGEKITGPRTLDEGDRVYMGPPGSPESASFIVATPQDDMDLSEPAATDIPVIDLGVSGDSEPFQLLDNEATAAPAVAEELPPVELAPAWDVPEPPPAPPPPPPSPLPTEPSPEPPKVAVTPRPAPKPEYTSEVSIAPEREREPLPLIPPPTGTARARATTAARPAIRPAPTAGGSPRLLVIGGVAAALIAAVGAYFVLRPARPVLQTVTPSKVEPGATVTLAGTSFASDASGNTVRFGDAVGEVVSATADQIAVKAPAQLKGGDVPVTVETRGGRSNSLFCKVFELPRITSLTPDVALPGAEIVIAGQNLDAKPVSVVIGGLPVEPSSTSATSLTFRIPSDLPFIEGKSAPVLVQAGGETSKPSALLLGRLPLLAAIGPSSGPAGTRVTLKGRGFGATPDGNVVTFGTRRALILTATSSEIVVLCPGSDASGSLIETPIRLEAGGSRSAGVSYQLTRSSSGVFVPLFFPLPAPEHQGHDHAIVASDLGPLLLLTGKASATSTAERAVAAAAALNDLIQSALAGKAAAVEYREKPEPGVAVIGAAAPFVTARAEDTAAYQESWGTAKAGGRVAPARLAAYWTALVKDYLGLFALKERPYHVLEISPRGKILLEIFGEAARLTGGSGGVPMSLVSPCPSRLAEDLRNLALVLPAEGEARGSAAIEGLWDGFLELPSVGRREIKVRFRPASGGLGGTLTTKVQTIVLNTPLDRVSYQKGAVTFTAALSGQPHTFRGTLQTGTISGTVHQGNATEPAGQFALNFVE